LATGWGRTFFFYSIRIDPKHDTPAVESFTAEQFGAGPGWFFQRDARRISISLSQEARLYSRRGPVE